MKKLAVKKEKQKEWFNIIAPTFEKEIGKTLATDEKALLNRRVTVSAVDLTNNLDKYYLKFIFKIKKVEGKNAYAEFDGLECTTDYISRMVVRRVTRIDAIQDLKTSDGRKIRVKSIAIVYSRIKSSIQKAIRAKIEQLVKSEIEKLTLEEIAKEMLKDEIKNKILKEISKIYPVKKFEIRKAEVLS